MAEIDLIDKESNTEQTPKKRGGPRPGAGRPPGAPNKATLERREVEEGMKQKIMASVEELLRHQLLAARGVTYLYRIDENKKGGREHVIVTDPDEIGDVLSQLEGGLADEVNDNYYYISTRAPDTKAIDSLLDRVFGKARQTVEIDVPKSLVDLLKHALPDEEAG